MAIEIQMLNPQNGLTKKGYVGFSWTTLVFSVWPALFRCDFKTFTYGFIIMFVISLLTYGVGGLIAMVVWPFLYNGYYTRALIEKGYQLNDTDERNAIARRKLGITAPRLTPAQ
jgi:hypothetical protein